MKGVTAAIGHALANKLAQNRRVRMSAPVKNLRNATGSYSSPTKALMAPSGTSGVAVTPFTKKKSSTVSEALSCYRMPSNTSSAPPPLSVVIFTTVPAGDVEIRRKGVRDLSRQIDVKQIFVSTSHHDRGCHRSAILDRRSRTVGEVCGRSLSLIHI